MPVLIIRVSVKAWKVGLTRKKFLEMSFHRFWCPSKINMHKKLGVSIKSMVFCTVFYLLSRWFSCIIYAFIPFTFLHIFHWALPICASYQLEAEQCISKEKWNLKHFPDTTDLHRTDLSLSWPFFPNIPSSPQLSTIFLFQRWSNWLNSV